MKEVPSSGDKLSWVGVREITTNGVKENVWIQCRLDRAFGNAEWFRLFPRSHTLYLERLGSDHWPILTSVLGSGPMNRGRFVYGKRWSSKPEVVELVRKGWNMQQSNSTVTVSERIASCRKVLSKWKRNDVSNSKKMITKLRAELEEEEEKKIDPSMQRMVYLKLELAKLFQEEEEFWRLKSKKIGCSLEIKILKFFIDGRRPER